MKPWVWLALGVLGFYLVTHLLYLTGLPIFADEAIYIRWAQLIIDDPGRYAFFALNDGKTPLFIWWLVPWLQLIEDQLLAARLSSVVIGLIQVGVMGWLGWRLTNRRRASLIAMVLTSCLPFWYFHHRMALMDGLLTLFWSLNIVVIVEWWRRFPTLPTKRSFPALSRLITICLQTASKSWPWLAALALTVALALLTKLPAVLWLPSLVLWSVWRAKSNQESLVKAFLIALGVGLGGLTFGLLRLHPAFGQLFSRGSDFLYPISGIVSADVWSQTLPNWPTYLGYLLAYLGWPILVLGLVGFFTPGFRRLSHVLWWSAWLFALPIMILGMTVYPRYLLPMIFPLTLGAVVGIEALLQYWWSKWSLLGQVVVAILLASFLAQLATTAASFILPQVTIPDNTPFVSADRVQYLTEWSSGHGIKEAVALMQTTTQTQPLAVATEGYFGTLPDGILAYLHTQNVEHLYVEGIGQPVHQIPEVFWQKATNFPTVWLVVNSHRLNLELAPELLVAEYCRPDHGPCLQVWDITSLRPSD